VGFYEFLFLRTHENWRLEAMFLFCRPLLFKAWAAIVSLIIQASFNFDRQLWYAIAIDLRHLVLFVERVDCSLVPFFDVLVARRVHHDGETFCLTFDDPYIDRVRLGAIPRPLA